MPWVVAPTGTYVTRYCLALEKIKRDDRKQLEASMYRFRPMAVSLLIVALCRLERGRGHGLCRLNELNGELGFVYIMIIWKRSWILLSMLRLPFIYIYIYFSIYN